MPPFADDGSIILIRKGPIGELRYELDYNQVVEGREPNPLLKKRRYHRNQVRPALPATAFLGPEGSYTEQALCAQFEPAERIPCASISEVFRVLAEKKATCGFVPLENMIQGPVTETFDELFQHKGNLRIVDTRLEKISHCLGVLQKKKYSEVKQIFSHQQALNQCASFLSEHLSHASRNPMASTGAAAAAVAEKKLDDAAVIAGKNALEQYGFHILAEDIADAKKNRTRFAVISSAKQEILTTSEPPLGCIRSSVTSIALDPGKGPPRYSARGA